LSTRTFDEIGSGLLQRFQLRANSPGKSFYYRPGRVPERLGVLDPSAYPDSNELWKVMKLPFALRS